MIGETANDISEDGWGVYDVRRSESKEKFNSENLNKGLIRFLSPLYRSNIPTEFIYSTTAVKCMIPLDIKSGCGKKYISDGEIKACIQNHLGPELEKIQPNVLWVYGKIGLKSISFHFCKDDVSNLDWWGVKKLDAPDSWDIQEILVIKMRHPKDLNSESQKFAKSISFTEVFLAKQPEAPFQTSDNEFGGR